MGPNLRKQLLVFENLIDAAQLPEIKLRTNALEQDLADSRRFPEPRPAEPGSGVAVAGQVHPGDDQGPGTSRSTSATASSRR